MIENFHANGTASWGLSPQTLAFFQKHVAPDATTLETGAGHSTLFFAKHGCTHTVITPDGGEVARIKAYCASNKIDLSKVTFIVEPSQDVMPRLQGSFDFFLIDGGHGFPIPQIDWFYGSRLLKVGGVIAIDDVHTWTGAILQSFLEQDRSWEAVETIDFKTACFRLVRPFKYEEWNDQPFVKAHSKRLILSRKLRRLPGRIARGEWATMYRSFKRSIKASHREQEAE